MRRRPFLTKIKVEVLGLDKMKDLYDSNLDFSEAWREYRAPHLSNQPSMKIILLKKVCCSKEFSYVY